MELSDEWEILPLRSHVLIAGERAYTFALSLFRVLYTLLQSLSHYRTFVFYTRPLQGADYDHRSVTKN